VYPTCNAGWSVCNQQGVGLGPDTILVVPTPNLPVPTIIPTDPLCNNGCNGSIVVTPIGGTGPFNISWNNGLNTLTLNNLCSGTYTFILTDAIGCSYNGTSTLNNPAPLQQPTITTTNPLCYGYCDGLATVNPIDGISPYTFMWNNNQTTQTANNLCSGTYSVTVYDANNCPTTQNVTLLDPPQVTINPITGLDTICYNSQNNLYSVSSVFPGLNYVWTNGIGNITSGQGTNQINLDVTAVNGGLYNGALSVIGVNGLGCQSSTQTFNIVVLNITPQINQIDSLCEYDNCLNLIALPPGGQFTGQNVSQNQYCPNLGFIGIDNITYQFQQSGCTFFANSQIQVFGRPQVTVTPDNQFLEICDGDSLLQTYLANSPSGGYNQWIFGQDTTISPELNINWTTEGIFTFQVIRVDNGCQSNPQSVSVTIQLCPDELIWIPNTFTPDDNEYNQYFTPVITSGVDVYQYQMQIFNRWGEVVWESFDVNSKWDGTYGGTKCADGVYIWQIRFGVPKTDEVKEMRGHLTILR
jgi:gliding motility-associated-like protein